MTTLVVWPDRCAGCRICELICAAYHFGVNNPKKAAIRVTPMSPKIASFALFVCRQCSVAVCVEKCPTNAIYKAEDGRVLIDEKKCTGCRACLEVCPFEAVFFHPDVPYAIKCDLCGGDPMCVKYCPTKALEAAEKS